MNKQALLDRFLTYIKINTQSDPHSNTIPSSPHELTLIKLLEKQLDEMKVTYNTDKYGYLSLKIPGNVADVPSIGFLAHVDTAPDYNGADVNPQIFDNYQGQDIFFSNGEVFSAKKFKELNNYLNKTIITTDGTSLLGGDDKAGVAIIMELIKYFKEHEELKHGDIYVAFTLDEEIGTGVDNFDLAYFKPDFAYTIDGGEIGELNYETFNAASLDIIFNGLNVHPGSAKNKMINTMELAHEFHAALPKYDKPEYTDNYEGFNMLMTINGNVEKTTLNYIIRDHSSELFNYRKEYLIALIENMRLKYPESTITYVLNDQYYNMKEQVLAKKEALDLAKTAMKLNDVMPLVRPIRGGTDGSKLSFRNIPCPNLFTGGHNFHGKYEFICLDSMLKALAVSITIIKENAK
jgi:tripeptide aminopeptidase